MFSRRKLPNQLPGEKVIKHVRRDLFILFKNVAFLVFLVILPMLILWMILSIYPNLKYGEISYPLMILSGSAYYLFVWIFFFFSFIDYYLDLWIVTNRRIINIEQRGFFSRIISEQKLYRIQDVTIETRGIFPTVLKYGSVFVQTAGTKRNFHFEEVPHPDQIKDTIISLVQKDLRRHRGDKKDYE